MNCKFSSEWCWNILQNCLDQWEYESFREYWNFTEWIFNIEYLFTLRRHVWKLHSIARLFKFSQQDAHHSLLCSSIRSACQCRFHQRDWKHFSCWWRFLWNVYEINKFIHVYIRNIKYACNLSYSFIYILKCIFQLNRPLWCSSSFGFNQIDLQFSLLLAGQIEMN